MFEDIPAQMREAFQEEAAELLTELDAALLELESKPHDSDLINRIFRAIHTIKGSGATAGFAKLARFTHRVEEVFESARQGHLTVTPAITDATLKACDVIRSLIAEPEESPLSASASDVLKALEENAGFGRSDTVEASNSASSHTSSSPKRYKISFSPDSSIFFSGADPVLLLDELRTLGRCRILVDPSALPGLEQFDPELCYLHWEVELISEKPIEAIREVFVFVEESDLRIDVEPCEPELLLDNLNTFPEDAIQAFLEEAGTLIDGAEALLIAIEGGMAAGNNHNDFLGKLRSTAEAVDILVNQKKKALPTQHPLLQIGQLCKATVSCFGKVDGFEGKHIEVLFRTLECLKRQHHSLFREEIAPIADPELLKELGIAPSVTESSDAQDNHLIFLEAAEQCLEAMRGGLARLKDDISGGSADMLARAFHTLVAIARFHGFEDAFSSVSSQASVLERDAQSGTQCYDAWSSLVETSEKLIRGVLQQETAPSAQTSAAKADQPTSAVAGKQAPTTSIRVDQEKLDGLMRVVGELLVARGMFPILARRIESETGRMALAKEVRDAGGMISRLAEDLQNSVMSIRMLPIRTVFQRIPRLVRDLSRTLDKQVELSLTGEETELDKAVIEHIGDPLVHIIRNAIDHGIELPESRLAKGKGATGHVKVSAFNQANCVVVQITDDGKGLDPAMLKKKAVEKGLITTARADEMSTAEALDLIFAAGFSTAEKVTDVSGRGVGMDVVRNNIRNLQGTVAIQSAVGQGTTFTIKLPTSLMVSKGILVSASGQEYVFPIEHVRDLIKVKRSTIRQFRGKKLANVRGRILAIESLDRLLGESPLIDNQTVATEEICVAVLSVNGTEIGVIVDSFRDEVETIIKPLPAELADLSCFLGATIMGDGRIVLIVNPEELLTEENGAHSSQAVSYQLAA